MRPRFTSFRFEISCAGQFIPLAGDELTPQQLAEAFSTAQGRQVSFQELPPWPLLLFCRDAYNYTRFLREKVRGRRVGAAGGGIIKQFWA